MMPAFRVLSAVLLFAVPALLPVLGMTDEEWAAQFETLKASVQSASALVQDAEKGAHMDQAIALLRDANILCRFTVPTTISNTRVSFAQAGQQVPSKVEKRLGTLSALAKKVRTARDELYPVAKQMAEAMVAVNNAINAQVAQVPQTEKQRKKTEKRVDAISVEASRIKQLDQQLLKKMKVVQEKLDLYDGIVKGASSSSG